MNSSKLLHREFSKSCSLKELPAEERPRERLKRIGAENLSLQELLALLIQKGGRKQNVLQIAQNLLSTFGSLQRIRDASLEELRDVSGIGTATACKLKAAFILGAKAADDRPVNSVLIANAADVCRLMKSRLAGMKKEHFYLLSLDARNNLLAEDEISVGILDSSLVHPREVFQQAIKRGAARVIIVHNHPSGDPSPSKDDIKLTERLKEAGALLGIPVKAHVIIGANSFKEV